MVVAVKVQQFLPRNAGLTNAKTLARLVLREPHAGERMPISRILYCDIIILIFGNGHGLAVYATALNSKPIKTCKSHCINQRGVDRCVYSKPKRRLSSSRR